MKYPLKMRHWIGRELSCYFLGHKWKSSKTIPTKYYGYAIEEVPYSYRASVGNYMWEDLASWSTKCIRCRSRLRKNEWPTYPWYKILKWAIMGFCRCFKISVECLWKYYPNCPIWKKIIATPISGFLFGVEQSWSYFSMDWGWPEFPMSIACELSYKLDNWLDKYNKEGHPNGVETSLEPKQT